MLPYALIAAYLFRLQVINKVENDLSLIYQPCGTKINNVVVLSSTLQYQNKQPRGIVIYLAVPFVSPCSVYCAYRNSVNNAFLRLFRYVRTDRTMTIRI